MATGIEWTEETWNPVTGCTQVSPGCANCYAKAMAKRLQAMGNAKYKDGFKVTCHPSTLDIPRRWKKPREIFVCSMGDLFHVDVPLVFILQVFDVMRQCPQHTFQVLTKRAQRMCRIINNHNVKVPENVWLGVSVENQECADSRIPALLETPADTRFISVEPMLEEINLDDYGCRCRNCGGSGYEYKGEEDPLCHVCGGTGEGSRLDWVIAGCESGPGRRHADVEWFRQLRSHCLTTATPFFLKQMEIYGNVVKMPKLDGVVWDQKPGEGE